jgi:eukaryotic-like serine/threonine-protein kinase
MDNASENDQNRHHGEEGADMMGKKKWSTGDPSGDVRASTPRPGDTLDFQVERKSSPASEVTLHVTAGPLRGKEFVFNKPSACIIGRAQDCDIQLSPEEDREVSRHHCLLEFIPPTIRLCDLGSTNGTFVNGQRVVTHWSGESLHDQSRAGPFEAELRNGDEISLGKTVLRVSVHTGTDESRASPDSEETPGTRGWGP